jgi:hypothetical protein
MAAQSPLITSTPYMREVFLQVHRITPNEEWYGMFSSIARCASDDIEDCLTSGHASSCSYSRYDKGDVINAAD